MKELVVSDFEITTKFVRGRVHRPPPYFSSIGKCGREQYYEMLPFEAVEGEHVPWSPSHPWQTTLGYAGQDLVVKALQVMGYDVTDQEKPSIWAGLNGRIDGKLQGHDLDSPKVWDCKLRNSFSIVDVVKYGLPKADKAIYCQMQSGIASEGEDGAIVTFIPYDVSDTRSRLKMSKIIDYNPHITRVVLPRDEEAIDIIEERSDMLRIAVDLEMIPAREYDPEQTKGLSPCNLCRFKQQCLSDGPTRDYVITPLPSHWNK